MPELPEVAAIADYVDGRAAGLPIRRVDVASLSVLKTADPPYTALMDRIVESVGRVGKYLVIRTIPGSAATASEPLLQLVIHLSRAGWVRWSEDLSPKPLRPGGKSPIALRVHCGLPGEGFDVTEAGTQKRLAVWIVRDLADIDRVATLGKNSDAYLITFLACARAGYIHVPLNYNLLGRELDGVLDPEAESGQVSGERRDDSDLHDLLVAVAPAPVPAAVAAAGPACGQGHGCDEDGRTS